MNSTVPEYGIASLLNSDLYRGIAENVALFQPRLSIVGYKETITSTAMKFAIFNENCPSLFDLNACACIARNDTFLDSAQAIFSDNNTYAPTIADHAAFKG